MNELEKILRDNLPKSYVDANKIKEGEPGEELIVDEASVWKRILDYRVVRYLKSKSILETHAGLNVATDLYRIASPDAETVSCSKFERDIPENSVFDYIDIDPFGQPYKAIEYALPHSTAETVWAVTNGEILQVSRNLKGIHLQSGYKGKEAYKWVENVFIPYLENLIGAECDFYYIFPTSVRVILSNKKLPKSLFDGCPVYMSHIRNYVKDKRSLF